MEQIKSGLTGVDLTDRWGDREIYLVCVALLGD